jgi:hypothetical protein
VNGPNSEGGLPEQLLLPRRPGIYIPREVKLAVEWEEGKEEGYVLRFPDGTVLSRYPLERLFLKHHTKLLKELEEDDSGWALMHYLEHLERNGVVRKEEVEMHKLAVHPFNVRHISIDLNDINDAAFNRLIGLAKDGMLLHRLIAVRVDPDTAKQLKRIAEVARKYGYNPDEVLTGRLWRIVRLEGDEIVAREDDEVYSAVSKYYRRKGMGQPDGRIKYLIIDGYQRYVAYCYVKLKELDSWKAVPKVPVYVIRSGPGMPFVMDPLSVIVLSIKANDFQRDLFTNEEDREAFARFLMHFEGVDVALEKLGAKLNHAGIANVGKAINAQLSQLSKGSSEEPLRLEFHIGYIGEEAEEAQPPAVEEEEREERRWERKEEPAVGPSGVSTVQRQPTPTTPTFSIAPAQPQAPSQIPISPPAQHFRKEVLSPGAPSRLEPGQVILSLLNRYEGVLPQLIVDGAEIEIVTTIKYDERKLAKSTILQQIKEKIGERLKGRARLVLFDKRTVEVNGVREKVTVILPILYTPDGEQFVRCPNCNKPTLVGPPWCLNCKAPLLMKEFPLPLIYETEQDQP